MSNNNTTEETIECYNCGNTVVKGIPHDCPAFHNVQTISSSGEKKYFATVTEAIKYGNEPENNVAYVNWPDEKTDERIWLMRQRVVVEEGSLVDFVDDGWVLSHIIKGLDKEL